MSGTYPTVPAVRCAPWCADGDGHPNECMVEDQTCWGTCDYVFLSGERPEIDASGIYPAVIGALPHRPYGAPDDVYVHLVLPERDIDTGVQLTPSEARALAVRLLVSADLVDPPAWG